MTQVPPSSALKSRDAPKLMFEGVAGEDQEASGISSHWYQPRCSTSQAMSP